MLLLACAGCGERAPGGQVLAVVNGEEITVPELNTEARARGLVIGDNMAVRDALLQELIDRKLLAQAARKQRLDRTPDFILESRRATELALAQELVTDTAGAARPLGQAQLNSLIAANPQAFADRAVVTVEQVSLTGPIPPAKAAAVGAADSLEQAVRVLGNPSLAAAKAMQTWDTARLDPASAATLMGARSGQVTPLHPPGSGWLLVRKVSATPSPVPADQQSALAAELAKSQVSQQIADRLLARERAKARIATTPPRATKTP